MKRSVLSLLLIVAASSCALAQRKVLLEHFTGAHCADCPLGSYYVDSMAAMYPDLIPVNLHTYAPPDSMFSIAADTLAQAYVVAAPPLGAIDRIYHAGGTGIDIAAWDSTIQQRLAATPKVEVLLNATWDSVTRDISTHVQVSILSNLDSADYRMGLYIVEDSVVGSGSGYNQANSYNATAGSPFFGLGDPIVGFMHRHVVRALLPETWGLGGIFASAPTVGQNYAHIFHYTLPANYDQHKVSVVAFMSAYTSDHMGDSVLNAAQQKLNTLPPAHVANYRTASFSIYPNPSGNTVTFASGDNKAYTLYLYNTLGQVVLKKDFNGSTVVAKTELMHSGVYFSKIMQGREQVAAKTISFLD